MGAEEGPDILEGRGHQHGTQDSGTERYCAGLWDCRRAPHVVERLGGFPAGLHITGGPLQLQVSFHPLLRYLGEPKYTFRIQPQACILDSMPVAVQSGLEQGHCYPIVLDINVAKCNRVLQCPCSKSTRSLSSANLLSRYLLHLSGVAYSSRLKYLLLCGSAVVFPHKGEHEHVEFWQHLLKDRHNIVLTGA